MCGLFLLKVARSAACSSFLSIARKTAEQDPRQAESTKEIMSHHSMSPMRLRSTDSSTETTLLGGINCLLSEIIYTDFYPSQKDDRLFLCRSEFFGERSRCHRRRFLSTAVLQKFRDSFRLLIFIQLVMSSDPIKFTLAVKHQLVFGERSRCHRRRFLSTAVLQIPR